MSRLVCWTSGETSVGNRLWVSAFIGNLGTSVSSSEDVGCHLPLVKMRVTSSAREEGGIFPKGKGGRELPLRICILRRRPQKQGLRVCALPLRHLMFTVL